MRCTDEWKDREEVVVEGGGGGGTGGSEGREGRGGDERWMEGGNFTRRGLVFTVFDMYMYLLPVVSDQAHCDGTGVP